MLSMIRIWNYNKSRIHSYRGVKHIEVLMDGSLIFKGDIKKSPGIASSLNKETCAECLVFTNSSTILDIINARDASVYPNNSLEYLNTNSDILKSLHLSPNNLRENQILEYDKQTECIDEPADRDQSSSEYNKQIKAKKSMIKYDSAMTTTRTTTTTTAQMKKKELPYQPDDRVRPLTGLQRDAQTKQTPNYMGKGENRKLHLIPPSTAASMKDQPAIKYQHPIIFLLY